jgi:hypothetical protein
MGLDKQVAPMGLVFNENLFLQAGRPDGTKNSSVGAKCL